MGKHILCIDDEANCLKIYEKMFREWEWTCVCVQTEEEALEAFSGQGPFDAVIIDYYLKDTEGKSLFNKIMAIDNTTKCIILSAAYDENLLEKFENSKKRPYVFYKDFNEFHKIKMLLEARE